MYCGDLDEILLRGCNKSGARRGSSPARQQLFFLGVRYFLLKTGFLLMVRENRLYQVVPKVADYI
jgi:hypothetical protein